MHAATGIRMLIKSPLLPASARLGLGPGKGLAGALWNLPVPQLRLAHRQTQTSVHHPAVFERLPGIHTQHSRSTQHLHAR